MWSAHQRTLHVLNALKCPHLTGEKLKDLQAATLQRLFISRRCVLLQQRGEPSCLML